jgi:hypothetical protein
MPAHPTAKLSTVLYGITIILASMIRRLHVPLTKPEDVIPHLAKQELHWRAGYSAQELAVAWADAGNSFPASVRNVLKTAPEYAHAELVDAFLSAR